VEIKSAEIKSAEINPVETKKKTKKLESTPPDKFECIVGFREKDHDYIISLVSLADTYKIDESYIVAEFKKLNIIIYLKPFKTKTTVIINSPKQYNKYIPEGFEVKEFSALTGKCKSMEKIKGNNIHTGVLSSSTAGFINEIEFADTKI
jgi:hypothetical protein